MPFSLILEPGELQILRDIADKDNTSVAAVIRKALHAEIFKNHPDLARTTIENEVESFLDSVGGKLPAGIGGTARRSQLQKELVAKLLKSKGKK
jgi:hypothetical protein